MKKKLQNIISHSIPFWVFLGILLIWQLVCAMKLVPGYMLPSPLSVLEVFRTEGPLLWKHTVVTLQEAFWGLLFGVTLGFVFAVLMDRFRLIYKGFYPIAVMSQTIPTIAIAPLLVLWLGYGMTPKITLVVITTFFPITIGLLDGFRQADPDAVDLFRAMGAKRLQIFWYIKMPQALGSFFSGLRISATYSIVGAVISEWLGGFEGLGVYMVRVKKSYSFDKMFAVIFLISAVSLLLMKLVDLIGKASMPWEKERNKERIYKENL